LGSEYRAARLNYRRLLGEAVTVAQRARARARAPHLELYAERFLALADKHRDSPAALEALTWVLGQTDPSTDPTLPASAAKLRGRALAALERARLRRAALSEVCRLLAAAADPDCDRVLTAIHEKHTLERMRGVAALALALSRSRQAEKSRPTDPARARLLTGQAEEKFTQVIERFAGVRLGNSTLGDMARKGLQDVRYLNVGSQAQDIEGEDLDGKLFKLSDYRGRVVVLDFWA